MPLARGGKMKKVVWTIFFSLILCCAAMAGSKKKFLNDGDTEATTTLDQSTVAVIELWSNPSTGYGWRPKEPYGSHIQIVGSEFESSQPGMKGAWGKEKIYVVGASRGQSELVMQYRRAPANSVIDTLKFKFKAESQFKESFSVPTTDVQTEPPVLQYSVSADLGLPMSFNWCDQGGCTPIRDQGNCGSCWAFATTAPLESLILLNDGVTTDLSEQYLMSCNSDGWGCNGGLWAHDYHEWKTASGESEAGAVLESVFPYQDADVSCDPPHDKAYQIASWEYVCGSAYCQPTVDQLKQALYDHGPLTVSVCADTAFMNYSGGVFTGPGCSTLNHGVVLVGWNDDDSCWIVRNSWGTAWGENGYMRIQYGVSGIGSEACYVEYESAPAPDPDPDPDPEPEPEPDGNEISNGQTISDLSGSQDKWIYYYIDVPEGAANLTFQISGGSGDADLYTLQGAKATSSNYDCRPYRYGNNETCTYSTPEAGTWYAGIHAYNDFSGVNLTVSYDTAGDIEPEPETNGNEVTNGQTISGLGASQNEWLYYYVNVPEGAGSLSIQISGGYGDADLYTKLGAEPSTSSYDCRPFRYRNNEVCTYSSPQAGQWYIGIRAYRNFSGVSLKVSQD